MNFLDALFSRRTTNGPFRPDPVSPAHQQLLIRAAAAAPSQFNSQPWRFVVIEDRETIETIARISGESMTQVMSEGTFFNRYRKYFRFHQREMDEKRSGMLFDKLPAPLRPFTGQAFTPGGQKLMNRLGVPKKLGEENRKLVAGSPLLLGVMLERGEYRPQELSGFYSVFSMGAAMENLWLTTTVLGMGIQFVSFPMEVPENWQRIIDLLQVPDDLELMAVYRLGYVPENQKRPAIDWSSRERKEPSQFVFRETCRQPLTDWDGDTRPGPG